MSCDCDGPHGADCRRIAVVGPCASGKTLLVNGLRQRGYRARQVLQEHSYVPAMWQRITNPDVLIYLDVSLDATRRRRTIDYGEKYYQEQRRRLAHARQHADLLLRTDDLTPDEILARALSFLEHTA
jgi:GTPase SAR1 family protein